MNLRTAFAVTAVAVAVAVPSSASASDIKPPDINCGIVSCTYKYEEMVRDAKDSVDQCVDGAVRAVGYIIQGTPQPQECSI